MSQPKPAITCAPNGPYLLKSETAEGMSLKLPRDDADSVSTVTSAALCRCGGSRNKPYCDGTHKSNGFSDERIADGSQDRRSSYAGRGITIHDNRGICAHAGFCTDNLAAVFRMGEEPWIDPDGAAVEAIIDVINKCPSGALAYSLDGTEIRPDDQGPSVTVIKDGPYMVGGVELDRPLGDGVTAGRYTLCRCGASRNKPFCDGSHWHVGFKDEAG